MPFLLKNQGDGLIRKSRYVNTNGHRQTFDTSRSGSSLIFKENVVQTIPGRNDSGDPNTGTPVDVEFSGPADQDARITLLSGSCDRIVITARNADFSGELYLRVRRGRHVIFLQKLDISRFNGPDFVTRQIKFGFAVSEGENVDFDIEKLPTPGGDTAPTGAFFIRELGVTGSARFATEVRVDSEKGRLEDLNDNTVDGNNTELREGLPRSVDTGYQYSDWFETARGEFTEGYSGIPNINPDLALLPRIQPLLKA